MAGEFLAQGDTNVVCGEYKPGAVVRRTVTSTIYEAEYAGQHEEKARAAVVKVREVDESAADALVEKWRYTLELDHPNLQRVYDVGSCTLEGTHVTYAVLERADESLAGVLVDRALSRREVEEMLTPTLAALKYLHSKGCAHGSLKPSNVLALGDTLKLSSDAAIRIEDGGSSEEDIRALGALMVQALTRKMPEEVDATAHGLNSTTDAIAEIVRRCLDPNPSKRWTIEQIENRLKGSEPQPVAPVNVIEVPRARIAEWQAAQEKAARQTAVFEAEPQASGFPKWIIAGIAALVLAIALFSFTRNASTRNSETRAAQARTTAPVETPAPAGVETPATASVDTSAPQSLAPPLPDHPPAAEPTVQTEAPAKPSPLEPPVRRKLQATGRRDDGWSVIAAAYGSREAAEKRVRDMAKRFPKFDIKVQEQSSDRANFLVVLGQNLSEDDAASLRERAVRAGLPRDTYIKRVM
jgi:hypothetical protein